MEIITPLNKQSGEMEYQVILALTKVSLVGGKVTAKVVSGGNWNSAPMIALSNGKLLIAHHSSRHWDRKALPINQASFSVLGEH